MGSTEEVSLERPRPSAGEADEPSAPGSGDPPPLATEEAGAVAMVCTTCGKEGDHSAPDCPYRDLLARASRRHGPPRAPNRASPRVCPVCLHRPDPWRRRWDDDSSVRVSNLPEGTREPDLRRLLAPFGIVERVSLSPGSRSGVVELDEVEDAEEAIGWLDGDVHGGRVLRVEWAVPFDPRPPPICARCLRASETWIRVTNLSERTSERDLHNLACPFGIINSAHLAVDEETGSRRQVGIVEFDQREDAEDAVRWLNGHVFDELVLRVEGPLKL
ncbi:eukaryotic translation initiation factor 3 subunit G [Panicum miliaceum]|uniref:Eukaryotic translation initiation factor 3 subunit G n=1 Tax=Panicum miliaceum TaxID=4540 RepID=A0A3L6PW36_PANMI|nr:eukaryotic translation initiation factor 3 subunit G [Panicum miliaceum]